MVLQKIKTPLVLQDVPIPKPTPSQILIRVSTCGVCRTDLHLVDGELPSPKLPLILGHQIVGTIEEMGSEVKRFKVGMRVGVPWLAESCGTCFYCLKGDENLCDRAIYTGYTRDGGFAEYAVAHAAFAFPLPDIYSDSEVAPLLCPGLIGYRALRFLENGKKIGFYGFGVSAHLLVQVIQFLGGEVYAFTRKGNTEQQQFALTLGVKWAGGSDELPPVPLDGAILFAPVGELYPQALRAVRKGGVVVSAGIHMSDIPAFPYSVLWGERVMRSVTNLTRRDGEEFLELAPQIPIRTKVNVYELEDVNQAIEDQRLGKIHGAAVLRI